MKNLFKYLGFLIIFNLYFFGCDATGPMEFDFGGRIPNPPVPDTSRIYIMDSSGQNQHFLYKTTDTDLSPIFSPDGSKILFGYDDLKIMNIDGSNVTDLRGNGESHQFSPNGLEIIYVTNHESIYRVNVDGSDHKNLTEGVSGPGTEARAMCPQVSPDGSRILYGIQKDSIYICSMDADGNNHKNITNGLTVGDFSILNELAMNLSPDGSRIVFVIDGYINVVNIDGTQLSQLIDGYDPKFSPDGSKIIFVSNREENDEIYIMNTDGSNQTKLTNHDNDNPQFAMDGSKIVFVSHRDGNGEIYTMNIDGSNQTNLTHCAEADTEPQFSPDGTKIVFVRKVSM